MYRPGEVAETTIPVVPELVEVLYSPRRFGLDPDEEPFGCWDEPDWHIRGRLLRSSFGPQMPYYTVHLYLILRPNQANEIEQIYLQLVKRPSGADPSLQLVEGAGIPGLD